MAVGAPTLPLGLDPLIAEAKQRARRRRLLWLLAAGVIAAGLLAFDLAPASTGGGTSGTVPWLPTRPNIGPANPPLAAPCTASQLRGALGMQGAAGSLAGPIWLTNISHRACALVQQPRLALVHATSAWRIRAWPKAWGKPAPYDPLTPLRGSLRALMPGRSAATFVIWSNWCGVGSRRNGDSGKPPSAIAIAAPGGGRLLLSKDFHGSLRAPACEAPAPSRIAVTKFTPYVPQGPPSSALPLSARIASLPTVRPGAWLSYTVVLKNRRAKPFSFGRSCPAYTEDIGSRPVAYVLNCHAVGPIAPHGSVRFAMRIRVSRNPGNTLTWLLGPHSFGGGVLAQLYTARP